MSKQTKAYCPHCKDTKRIWENRVNKQFRCNTCGTLIDDTVNPSIKVLKVNGRIPSGPPKNRTLH